MTQTDVISCTLCDQQIERGDLVAHQDRHREETGNPSFVVVFSDLQLPGEGDRA